MLRMFKKDLAKHGDSQYTIKHQYPNYQIALANVLGYVYIEII
jgi:hypothetical protein